jgi:hypothetical protein
MPDPVRVLAAPELSNSDFCRGQMAWSFIKSAASLLDAGGHVDIIDLSKARHLKPYQVAIVAAIVRLNQRLRHDACYQEPQDDDVLAHLERLRLPDIIAGDNASPAPVRPTNLPIQIVEGRQADSFGWDAAQMLCQELGRDLPGGLLNSIAASIDEMVLNAATHSDSEIGCVVVGQAFPKTSAFEVVILDLGVTIRGHLSKKYPALVDDASAIAEALLDGVTGTIGLNRFNEPNGGAGLAALLRFLAATGGTVAILSGSAIVCIDETGRQRTHVLHGPPFRGTMLSISFATNPGFPGVEPRPPADL